MADTRLVGATEAARILGVKPATLYAYVSRGIVQRHTVPGDRGSWFERLELEELNRHKGRRPSASGLDLAIGTSITAIEHDRLYFRGHDAAQLARTVPYESVAGLLWTGHVEPVTFGAPKPTVAAVRRAARGLGSSARLLDHLSIAVTVAASRDPLRMDLHPASVIRAASSLVATMVDALPELGPPVDDGNAPLTARLWARLSPDAPPAGGVEALDAAMCVLADHELATSTLAARVAASTRADPYAAVGAALAALGGPLHGTASAQAVALLEAARTEGAEIAVAQILARGDALPGFGHSVYKGRDPRFAVILDAVEAIGIDDDSRRRVVGQVLRAAAPRVSVQPNSDFGIAALTWVTNMTADAGEAIFAIARVAGWIAHAIEEYGEAPLRFRGRTVYTGPGPEPA